MSDEEKRKLDAETYRVLREVLADLDATGVLAEWGYSGIGQTQEQTAKKIPALPNRDLREAGPDGTDAWRNQADGFFE